jgi:deazaflavin-dependent oxidoreductase (nitroreductase family)
MPAALDRRGLRWLMRGLSPAPIVVLVHRGRRSGKVYKTPVEAIAEDPERGEIVVSPMWGEESDWYRNVVAGGLVEARQRGEGRRLEWRRLSEEERREAIGAYRQDHPLYSRLILGMLVRLHRLTGDPVEAVVRSLPMLVLHPPPSGR